MSNFNFNYEDNDVRNTYLAGVYENRTANNRSANLEEETSTNDNIIGKRGPSKGETDPFVKGSTLWTPQHVAFLDQHIFLGKGAEAEDTFNFINQQLVELSNGFQNFREYPEEFKTIGYHLDETREGCFRIQLFTYNEKLGINCTRLDGDSIALGSLWSKLKQSLHENDYYVDKFLVDNEEDEDIFGDEDDNTETMDAFKYLDFSRDEAFVGKLVDDVMDINIGTHALMLLKFNFQKEKNLQLVAEKFSQKLFDNTVNRLNEQYTTLPASICASHILKHLLEAAQISVTVEQVSNMVNAAERLCTENEESRTIVPTASEEASTLILESVPQATEKASADMTELDIQEQLKRICTTTGFDQVRDSAEALMESN